MNQKDQLKVMKAGFTIIRSEEQTLKIKFKDSGCTDWRTLEGNFASKAGVKRRMEQLLKTPTIVED